jgi:hypothetical protein
LGGGVFWGLGFGDFGVLGFWGFGVLGVQAEGFRVLTWGFGVYEFNLPVP